MKVDTLKINDDEYQIFLYEKEIFRKKIDKNSGGEVDYKNKKINLLLWRWSDTYTPIVDEIHRTLWHEIGHLWSRVMPSSVESREIYAVNGEMFYNNLKQIKRISKNLNKTIKEMHETYRKNRKEI